MPVVTAEQAGSNVLDYRERLRNMIESAVLTGTAKVQAAASAGILTALYLYYKPSTINRDGALILITDDEMQPDGYLLATGEGLRADVPYALYFAWVHSRSSRLPVLAWA